MPKSPFIFLVGSPRSGTTILGEVLDAHPQIAQWYEPYFIWDRYFRDAPDDKRERQDATEAVKRQIRRAFEDYQKANGVAYVLDKSPRNCLKIPFVDAVFPEATFIFLLRDGRDTILSLYREWKNRGGLLQSSQAGRRWSAIIGVVRTWLKRQPFWRHRLQALLFELGSPRFWMGGRFLHRVRWNGRIGWGPRFRGWEEFIDRVSLLEFCAFQWCHCMVSILPYLRGLPEEKRYVLRYEDFTEDLEGTLKCLFSYLNVEYPDGFLDRIPPIKTGNYRKWLNAFSPEELRFLGQATGNILIELGYENDNSWYQGF